MIGWEEQLLRNFCSSPCMVNFETQLRVAQKWNIARKCNFLLFHPKEMWSTLKKWPKPNFTLQYCPNAPLTEHCVHLAPSFMHSPHQCCNTKLANIVSILCRGQEASEGKGDHKSPYPCIVTWPLHYPKPNRSPQTCIGKFTKHKLRREKWDK